MIRFESKTGASVTMFDKDAAAMLRMMSHSGTIPSAIRAENIPAALASLEQHLQAAAAEAGQQDSKAGAADGDDGNKAGISLQTRAYPLLELLRAAVARQETVMWDHDHSVV
ncbi:MAG: DUF1840 domain-containing protein [Thiothrix sp.]|nr:DUF1840 domain-containing protein [Thiothrix sp.]HPQ96475.1 DUF1840 domain-containing protein [Thiolinea sp.]